MVETWGRKTDGRVFEELILVVRPRTPGKLVSPPRTGTQLDC